MNRKQFSINMYYDCVIIGGGAAGLILAAQLPLPKGRRGVILESTSRPGTKLRLSGGGHCNFTHTGSIRDFIPHYHNASQIRRLLYRHNNEEFIHFVEAHGIPVSASADGRVFPASMQSSDILELLLRLSEENGFSIATDSAVCGISHPMDMRSESSQAPTSHAFSVPHTESCPGNGDCSSWYAVETVSGRVYQTERLVIASGGKSYPSTGSNGRLWQILQRDLNIELVPPHPALSPIPVDEYPYSDLAGLSLDSVLLTASPAGRIEIRRKDPSSVGSLLFTHKAFSGPAVLNLSAETPPGSTLHINYIYPCAQDEAVRRIRTGSFRSSPNPAAGIAHEFSLPKKFCRQLIARATGSSSLLYPPLHSSEHSNGSRYASGTGRASESKKTRLTEISARRIAALLTDDHFTISATGDWNQSMATRGGITLHQIRIPQMEFRDFPGLYAIGETLDVDGHTGGYNLQFAYSSACAAADELRGVLHS